jgi:hypothetical protein
MLRLTPETLHLPSVAESLAVANVTPVAHIQNVLSVGSFGMATLQSHRRSNHEQRFLCIIKSVGTGEYQVEYLESLDAKRFRTHDPEDVAWIDITDVQPVEEVPFLDRRGRYIFHSSPF